MALTNLGTINNAVQKLDNKTVTTSQPRDVYKFEIDNKRSINLLLIDEGYTGDADLALYRDDGDGILQTFGRHRDQLISTSQLGSSSDDHINRWSQPGTYFAVVEQYSSDSSISYDLYVSASTNSGFRRTGPPNTLAQEKHVGTLNHYYDDETFSGSVGLRRNSGRSGFGQNEVGDTSDLYDFTLAAGHSVDITLSGLSNYANIRLIKDDENNRILDHNPSDEVVDTSTNGGTADDEISLSTPGDYYLQVYPVRGSTTYELEFDVH